MWLATSMHRNTKLSMKMAKLANACVKSAGEATSLESAGNRRQPLASAKANHLAESSAAAIWRKLSA
jgi:hypothetical protein